MDNNLSAAMLADLELLTQQNSDKDIQVLNKMGEQDEAARHLRPQFQAEYQQFKDFFSTLVYHEQETRYISYLGPHRQSWVFFPMVDTDEGLAFIILGLYTLEEDEVLLAALKAQGCDLTPGMRSGAIKIKITSCLELQAALTAIQEHHAGYIVPGANVWLETHLARQKELERNKCVPTHPALHTLPLPDCWI